MIKYIRRAIASYTVRKLSKKIYRAGIRLAYINCMCRKKSSEYYDDLKERLQKEIMNMQERLNEAYTRLL